MEGRGLDELLTLVNNLSLLGRIVAFSGLAIVTHVVVLLLRQLASTAAVSRQVKRHQKLRSIATLMTSAMVFTLYFLAIGLILREFGVSLKAYLASASVVGLAVGFGSQGIVQDVVTGLTFIFSDLIDVGDLVQVSGQTGMVKAITMRFVELEDAMGAVVFIPNRTISNVTNYPRGYIRCIVDVTLRGNEQRREAIEATTLRQMNLLQQQFPRISLTAPSSEGRIRFDAGKEVLRVKFRIWPNRQQPIETTFLQELLAEITALDPDYKPWMVSISYEVEKKVAQTTHTWLWRKQRKKDPEAPPPIA
ncbi:MAG: mechanosensitive ion channel family protein [Gammaproteobacteria bacterium]|nr:mechanosensitive ion channel family protein [Gammaproteobacteria bacterium]